MYSTTFSFTPSLSPEPSMFGMSSASTPPMPVKSESVSLPFSPSPVIVNNITSGASVDTSEQTMSDSDIPLPLPIPNLPEYWQHPQFSSSHPLRGPTPPSFVSVLASPSNTNVGSWLPLKCPSLTCSLSQAGFSDFRWGFSKIVNARYYHTTNYSRNARLTTYNLFNESSCIFNDSSTYLTTHKYTYFATGFK